MSEDINELVKRIRLAAEQGDEGAQNILSEIDDVLWRNISELEKWIIWAAEQGDERAQYILGVMSDVLWEDKEEAEKWFREAAERGNAEAQFYLGKMYDNGVGVLEDKREAAKWYRKAAEQEDPRAQYILGKMYDNGEGVLQDKREAVKWYREAAERGDARAQFELGNMYDSGDGVLEDKREAVKWYREAAEQGVAEAQFYLGNIYDSGDGVPEDKREAVKWYRQAAEQGIAEAQNNLGVRYGNGEGAIQDVQEAYIWFWIAAANGFKGAAQNRDMAAQRLTSNEEQHARAEAERRLQTIKSRQSEQPQQPASDSLPHPFTPHVAGTPDIAPTPAEKAYEQGWRSVVVIETDAGGLGSGVIVGPNLVATNHHVIADGTPIKVFKAQERQAQKDEVFRAKIFRANKARDVCLLVVDDLQGIPATFRPLKTLRVGEAVYAIGAPEGFKYSLSAGVISKLRQESECEHEYVKPIQTDAAISHGSSGGGLFDAEGNLVGITTSGWGVEGINFAIPADWVLEVK